VWSDLRVVVALGSQLKSLNKLRRHPGKWQAKLVLARLRRVRWRLGTAVHGFVVGRDARMGGDEEKSIEGVWNIIASSQARRQRYSSNGSDIYVAFTSSSTTRNIRRSHGYVSAQTIAVGGCTEEILIGGWQDRKGIRTSSARVEMQHRVLLSVSLSIERSSYSPYSPIL